ncbi:hypothetical protein MVEN_01041600 [Mycena venus]|uniref:Uncharacterized protein n=1 Tax=Mycena venus TaxID=2733690 RepID=A0A8H6Y9U1_9AGAR|nr:hypothetical protein MVEN_01041600 [Mycena venus]
MHEVSPVDPHTESESDGRRQMHLFHAHHGACVLPVPPQQRRAAESQNLRNFHPVKTKVFNFLLQRPSHLAPKSPEKSHLQSRKQRSSPSRNPRLTLNRIKRPESEGWEEVGSTETTQVHKIFEHWKNDYHPHDYFQAPSIKIQHFQHPLDRPKDIRARPFIVLWDTEDGNPPERLDITKDAPVFRVFLSCADNCRHGSPTPVDKAGSLKPVEKGEVGEEYDFSDEDGDGYVDWSDTEPDVEPGSGSESEEDVGLNRRLNKAGIKKAKKKREKGKQKAREDLCPVQLHAEVRASNLNMIHFYQLYKHPKTRPEYLEMSQYIRHCIMECATYPDMTASSIKRRLLRMYDEQETPKYRRATASQVDSAVQNIRRKERLLNDPLRAIGLFRDANPDKIFHYSAPDPTTDPPTNFATGITNTYAEQSLILYSAVNGVGLDECWRNMNQNRAPVTLLTTINDNERMLPGPTYLSGTINTETQVEFLTRVKARVEKMAHDLVAGRVDVDPAFEHQKDRLLAEAQKIVDSPRGWRPAFIIIDKFRPSRIAIRRVFGPGIVIRICQFHVIQAILRWDREHGDDMEPQKRPKLSVARKHLLIHAVREIQRCRNPARWDEHVARFRTRVERLTETSASAQMIMRYFEVNWFCEEWRDYWTDIGLPPGANREGMLNTNNWTERAFKTFQQVFLCNRANKSMYRLVLIIANEWYQYYREWLPTSKKIDHKAIDKAAEAHRIWSSGHGVEEFPNGGWSACLESCSCAIIA